MNRTEGLAPQCPSKDPSPPHARCARRAGHAPPHHGVTGLAWNDDTDPQTSDESTAKDTP